MTETNKSKACFRCGHYPDEQDRYCTQCGAPLKNTCTNRGGLLGEPCKKINHPQAIFCASCGRYTTFYKAGLLTTAYPESHDLQLEEEFEYLQELNHYFFKD